MRFLILILFCFSLPAIAQQTQRISGTVTDKDTHMPLEAALIQVPEWNNSGIYTDSNGHFSIPDVPLGKVRVSCSRTGYQATVFGNLLLVAGKELQLQIELEASASVMMQEVRSWPVANNVMNWHR